MLEDGQPSRRAQSLTKHRLIVEAKLLEEGAHSNGQELTLSVLEGVELAREALH